MIRARNGRSEHRHTHASPVELTRWREPMKVLIAHVKYRLAGGEDAVYENECRLLESAGVEVIRLVYSNNEINEHGLINKLRLGANSVWSVPSYLAFKGQLDRHQPDIVHFHNTFPLLSPSVYSACHNKNIPVVQTLHNFRLVCPGALLFRDGHICEECLTSGVAHSIRHGCYRNSSLATAAVVTMLVTNQLTGGFQKVSRFIALTEFAAGKIRTARIPPQKIVVKPNFLMDPPDPNYEVGNYVLYVGRLSSEKGLETLLQSLIPLGGKVRLKIAGGGPEGPELEAFCRQNNIPVEFLGFLDKPSLLSQMKGAAFIVIPSLWYEGFPMVLLEAYACGKSILASRIGSLDELVTDNVTGKKFEPGDVPNLTATINTMFEDRAALEQMGRAARVVFEERYSAEPNKAALIGIYKDVLTERQYGTIGGSGSAQQS